MNVVKKLIGISALLILVAPAYAVDCPAAKITHVQAQSSSILVRIEGQNWHRIGAVGGPGVDAMFSAALAAQVAGLDVILRYPDGYDCSAYNTSTDAIMIRTVGAP